MRTQKDAPHSSIVMQKEETKMNPLEDNKITGTLGEILVQLRLLQYGVQASKPLEDSGNDLIAIKGEVFKAIQVRTTADDNPFAKPKKLYHILAYVKLVSENDELLLDKSETYLIRKEEIESKEFKKGQIDHCRITSGLVEELFN